MSKLFYDIPLIEEYDKDGEPYDERTMSEDHFRKVKDWLPGEFDKCKISDAFDGILKEKVESCIMRCLYRIDEISHKVPVARITATFVPGFRHNENKRQEFVDQMEDQMTDGFGMIYDKAEIPDGDGWQLKF